VVVISQPILVAAMVGIQGPWNTVICGQNVIFSTLTLPSGITMQRATKNTLLVVTEKSCG